MNKKRNIVFLIIGLLLPLIYHGLSAAWSYLWIEVLIDRLPENVRMYLLTNPLSFDAIFCFLMILIILPLFFKMRKEDKEYIPKEYIRPINGKAILQIIVITLGVAGITAIWQLFARTVLTNVEVVSKGIESFDQTFQAATSSHTYMWTFLSVVLFGPIVEELMFRGTLFSGLNRYLSGWWVVVLTAIYFGLWHSNPIQMVYTAILGFFVGLVYAATRNMWFPMLLHLFNNWLSALPPALENNENFMLATLIIRVVAIIPMFIIIYKMVKNNPAVNYKIGDEVKTQTEQTPDAKQEVEAPKVETVQETK